jgi:hypothetical protein
LQYACIRLRYEQVVAGEAWQASVTETHSKWTQI